MTMNIREIKKSALQSLKGRWGLAILLVIVSSAIYNLFPMLIEILFSGGINTWLNDEYPYWVPLLSLFVSIILIPIYVATDWVFLSIARNEEAKVADLFNLYNEIPNFFKSIFLTILIGIYVLLWSLLLIIPGIIKGIAYSQAYFIFKDNPTYSTNEIITTSRELMKGYKWKYFLLNLSFLGWAILTLFTLGIGLVWLIPYFKTALTTFYVNLTRQEEELI